MADRPLSLGAGVSAAAWARFAASEPPIRTEAAPGDDKLTGRFCPSGFYPQPIGPRPLMQAGGTYEVQADDPAALDHLRVLRRTA